MEILVILAILIVAGWFLFFRKDSSVSAPAPYKIETPPTPEPVVLPIPAFDVVPPPELSSTVIAEGAGVVEVIASSPVAEAAPVKKPRKPRAPKAVAPVEKPAAKKAAPVKKAAAIKAAPKARAPRSKKA